MAKGIRHDELALVEKANAGDRDAIGALYAMHESWVTRLAMRYTGNREDAEDVFQETLLTVHKKLRSLREPKALTTWLYRIVANTCLSSRRKSKFAHPSSRYITSRARKKQKSRCRLGRTGFFLA